MAKVIIEVYGGVAYPTFIEGAKVAIVDYDHLERTSDAEQEALHDLVIAGDIAEATKTYEKLCKAEEGGLTDAYPPQDVQTLRNRGYWG